MKLDLAGAELGKNIVMQGEVFGPLECSVTVDTIRKECLKRGNTCIHTRKGVKSPPSNG